ncbi:MAG: hypothetical protein ACHQZS_08245 [Candidatus Binatales bacterium]
MKRILLSFLTAAIFAPSPAIAQTNTYVFRGQFTVGEAVPTAAQNAAYQYSFADLTNFFATLAADTQSLKTCPDLSTSGLAFFKASATQATLKGITSSPGDTIFAAGSITTPAVTSGPVTGTAVFGGFSLTAGLKNTAALNSSNIVTGALLCGGNVSGGSGPGTCGNLYNCVNKNLNPSDPLGLTNCALRGGWFLCPGGGCCPDDYQQGSCTYTYFFPRPRPRPAALCNTAGETFADCCHDPRLALFISTFDVANGGSGPSYMSTVASQGVGGYAEAYLQPAASPTAAASLSSR